jgi:hypothetical protein
VPIYHNIKYIPAPSWQPVQEVLRPAIYPSSQLVQVLWPRPWPWASLVSRSSPRPRRGARGIRKKKGGEGDPQFVAQNNRPTTNDQLPSGVPCVGCGHATAVRAPAAGCGVFFYELVPSDDPCVCSMWCGVFTKHLFFPGTVYFSNGHFFLFPPKIN